MLKLRLFPDSKSCLHLFVCVLIICYPKTMTHYFQHFRAVILGAPGSGKGTISSWICRDFNLAYISVGDVIRNQVKHKTPFGQEAEQYISKGKLLPDSIVNTLVFNELHQFYYESSWLLDGYPRTLTQAQQLEKDVYLKKKQTKRIHLNSVVNLVVPDDAIIDRVKDRWIHLSSGRIYNSKFNPPKVSGKDDLTGEPLTKRDDDKPEVVAERLRSFHEQIKPVVDYYKYETKLILTKLNLSFFYQGNGNFG